MRISIITLKSTFDKVSHYFFDLNNNSLFPRMCGRGGEKKNLVQDGIKNTVRFLEQKYKIKTTLLIRLLWIIV